LDVLQLSGGIIQRINISNLLAEDNLRLVKLRHLKVPVLSWSNRLMNKPEITQKIVKILLTGVLELPPSPVTIGIQEKLAVRRQFVMSINLESR
jgi:hypothetical protein